MTARLTAGAYSLGWLLVRRLPLPVAWLLFRAGARLAARRGGKGARRLRSNLVRVTSPQTTDAELDALAADGLVRYARYWLEVFRLPAEQPAAVTARTWVEGRPLLMDALALQRGVVLALPHMGNWDQAGVWLVAQGVPFTTVAERLQPESLFDRFVAFREGLGMEVVPLTGGSQPPFDLLAERLRAGGVLCLLADRDLTPHGVPVRFFGEMASMPAGPALLALRTGAALLPVTMWWDDVSPPSPLHCRIHDPVAVPQQGSTEERVAAMTQGLADAFAESIAAHPSDWHMLARLWAADLAAPRQAGAGR